MRAHVLCLMLITSGSMVTLSAQQCDPVSQLKGAGIGNFLTPGPDGLIHVTYGFTDSNGNTTSNPTMQPALESAMTAWNNYSAVTGVTFTAAGAGQPPDVSLSAGNSISGDDASHDQCLVTDVGALSITYGSDFLSRFSNPSNLQGSIVGIEHEIGHILGLNDNSPAIGTSIMNKASSCANGSNATGIQPNDPTTTSDVNAAKSCVQLMLSSHSSAGLIPPANPPSPLDFGGGGGYTACILTYQDTVNTFWDGDVFTTEVDEMLVDASCY